MDQSFAVVRGLAPGRISSSPPTQLLERMGWAGRDRDGVNLQVMDGGSQKPSPKKDETLGTEVSKRGYCK